MFELSALQGDFCPKRIALTAMLEGHFLRLGGIDEDAKCPPVIRHQDISIHMTFTTH